MPSRSQLLRAPEYWFEEAQNELYRKVSEYQKKKGINQTQLAKELGVTKGYISQILKGEFNYTLKKLIEISLAIGMVPRIEYVPVSKLVAADATPPRSPRRAAAKDRRRKTIRVKQKAKT
jgi:transcriptional regulator with XRE-family HTH domain